jgi:CRISPR-associated protein Csm5
MIKHDGRKKDELANYVKSKLDKIDRDLEDSKQNPKFNVNRYKENQKKWFSQKFMDDMLEHFELSEKQRRYDPHTDIMRCLKISDSLNNIDGLKLDQVMLMSVSENDRAYNKTILHVECLQRSVKVELDLKVDENIISAFKKDARNKLPFENIDDIFTMMDEFGEAQWVTEREYFGSLQDSQGLDLNPIRKFYEVQYVPAIRVGWGSGLLGTTVDLLLPEDLRKRMRNTLFTDRDDDAAPKSRRFTVFQSGRDTYNVRFPLGWMAIGSNSHGNMGGV